ncbi:hypothetical protein EVAR_38697_1 [Eumeta japonica]|uniref:Uncharacterized protein n=1 Tax=Eumeta variegata TaxID=151549 RepID=A0A4C1XM67_EUMVA|nr:hypothetical protein EVAR_38697_1 [Eumeta japonica]
MNHTTLISSSVVAAEGCSSRTSTDYIPHCDVFIAALCYSRCALEILRCFWSPEAHAEVAAGHALCPIKGRNRQPSEALGFADDIRSDARRESRSYAQTSVGHRRASSGVVGLAEMSSDGTNSVRVFLARANRSKRVASNEYLSARFKEANQKSNYVAIKSGCNRDDLLVNNN